MTILHLSPLPLDCAEKMLAGAIAPGRDTSGGLLSVAELLAGAQCVEVIADDGRRVGAYAVQVCQHDNGAEAVVVAAVGNLPGADLTGSVLPAIVEHAGDAGCKAVTIYTRRRGLVGKLRAQGFELDGFIMRKKINNGR